MSLNEIILIVVCVVFGALLLCGVMFRIALYYRDQVKRLKEEVETLKLKIGHLTDELQNKQHECSREIQNGMDKSFLNIKNASEIRELKQKIDEYEAAFKRKNEVIDALKAEVQSRDAEIERLKQTIKENDEIVIKKRQEIIELKANIVAVDPTKKYEFTDEIKEYKHNGEKGGCTHVLHRIRALRDFGTVKKGDLGGWIAKEGNLSHDDNCWVGGEAMVFSNAKVYSNAQVYDKAQAYGNVVIGGNAKVYGNAHVYDNAEIWGSSQIYEDAKVYGYATVTNKAQVHGKAQVYEEALIYGTANIYENATVRGDVRIATESIGGGTLVNSGEMSAANKNGSSQKKSK
ncbi:hypothetical protein [Bartonella sp. AD13SXNS]|uniref:hypothetical protein n=1 Tax=Bartonella sp. AD13SXNS TaxID=3243462 RepID=UPI0035D02113